MPGKGRVTQLAADEVQLPLDKLLWSRTNGQGDILAANSELQKTSGLAWKELLGASHSFACPPAMPKAAYQVFLRELKKGKPVGAYARNCNADGQFYWVFTVAIASDDGYISVGLSPQAQLRQKVETIYADLIQQEECGLSADDGAKLFEQEIVALGFTDFDDFVADALSKEFTLRESALGRPSNLVVAKGVLMADAMRSTQDSIHKITRHFEKISNVPTNIRILASQLEQGAGPVSVISTNHSTLSHEMIAGLEEFRISVRNTSSMMNRWQLLACVSSIMTELVPDILNDADLPDSLDAATEAGILEKAVHVADETRSKINSQTRSLSNVIAGFKRQVTGLDVTRIMCKIENARFTSGNEGLSEIIDHLEVVQEQISKELSVIEKNHNQIHNATRPKSVRLAKKHAIKTPTDRPEDRSSASAAMP